MSRLLIKGGHVIDPAAGVDEIRDVLVEDGKIASVAPEITTEAETVIDASGKWVMPGLIDLHVHFREPGFTYKETVKTGSLSAAAGGYTSVCPMPNTSPVLDSKETAEAFMEIVKRDAVVHVFPVGAITKGQEGKELADIKGMKEAGVTALSEDGKSVMDAALYEKAMEIAAKLDLPVFAHCEDKDKVNGGVMNAGKKAEELSLPGITNEVEDIIAKRDIELSEKTGARLHLCHCSTKESPEYIREAKERNLKVTGEVCPHHFAMSEEEIATDDGNYKMNPPLRGVEDVEALKQGLADGSFDVISTDHAPHGWEEKNQSMLKAPFGIVGLETAFCLSVTHLVETGLLTRSQLVEKMSRNPAKVLGVEKGSLQPGMAADIAIADFEAEWVIDREAFFSKGKNTPFHGKKVKGRIEMTLVDGVIVYSRK